MPSNDINTLSVLCRGKTIIIYTDKASQSDECVFMILFYHIYFRQVYSKILNRLIKTKKKLLKGYFNIQLFTIITVFIIKK